MRAVSFSGYGGPDVLRFGDTDDPQAGPGQLRVAVRAAAVNPFDWKVRRGDMAPNLPPSFPAIPGYDLAGVVDQVGDGVRGVAVGDEVLGGSITGAYAEYALADPAAVIRKPDSVDWTVAGGFGSVARTADRVLRLLGVGSGDTVLVAGAAGAVGQLTVQLTRHRGADVVGTASPANHDRLEALGATPVA